MAKTTSEECTWFNETDRVLTSIVRKEEGRRPGHGQMVVMRVYATTAQENMQRCLRKAVELLGLHDGSPQENPLFSVIFDNGGTSNLSTHIEPYFLTEFSLSGSAAGEGAYTLDHRQRELEAPQRGGKHRRHQASLSYADLLNVPVILILVDKGRTGDTFPQSLGYFDLRIRTVRDSYTTFEQELGRLCRYQTFRPIDDGKFGGCSQEMALERGGKVSTSVMEVPSAPYEPSNPKLTLLSLSTREVNIIVPEPKPRCRLLTVSAW